MSHFWVFECVCYVFVPDHLRSKFDKKAIRCIFVGYSNKKKRWKCCDPTIGWCYTSKDVVFDEASLWWSPQKVELPNSKDTKKSFAWKESPKSTKGLTPTIGKIVRKSLFLPARQKNHVVHGGAKCIQAVQKRLALVNKRSKKTIHRSGDRPEQESKIWRQSLAQEIDQCELCILMCGKAIWTVYF